MENSLIENSPLNAYFKINYNSPNLGNNPELIKWKQSIIALEGKDIKFLKCKDDNIIFYCTKKSLKEDPVYQSNCPVKRYLLLLFNIFRRSLWKWNMLYQKKNIMYVFPRWF